MLDGEKSLGTLGTVSLFVLLAFLFIKTTWLKAKTNKAEARARALEHKIKDEEQDRALEKTVDEEQVLESRIRNRKDKLAELYRQIEGLGALRYYASELVADARKRLGRGPVP